MGLRGLKAGGSKSENSLARGRVRTGMISLTNQELSRQGLGRTVKARQEWRGAPKPQISGDVRRQSCGWEGEESQSYRKETTRSVGALAMDG